MYASPGDDGHAQVNHIATLMDTGPRDETGHPATTGPPAASARSATEIVAIPGRRAPVTRPVPACYQATPDTWI